MAAAAPFCSASVPLTPTKPKETAHFPFFIYPSSSPSPSARSSGFLRSKCRKSRPLSVGQPRWYVSASGSSFSTEPPASPPAFCSGKKLYVSGLSFRTTEQSLRKAFDNFGELVEVNLVMDKIANRPRGFAFLRYATDEESQRAIEGMHGKFLDGRVIFVEVAKPRSELRQNPRQPPR